MRFETAIPVGEGASAEVYRAYDPARGEDVALKVLRRSDPDTLARIEREVAIQRRLDHPSVCPILGVEELDGRTCLVMPFVEGRPIDEAAGDLDLADRVRLVRDVADALAHAHQQGALHRDVKPGNILIESRDGRLHPWLLDFGLARSVESETLTLTGQALGTPGYMAPEQVRGEQGLDARCDVYGLGAVLFELLTGRRPHTGSTTAELLVATVTRDAPDPRRWVRELPASLANIVGRCLERKPRYRYGDAGALRDDLDAWLAGRSVAADRGRWLRLLRRTRTRRAIGITALALVALGLGVFYALDRQRASERAAGFAAEAQRYATVAADLESRMRLVFARPLHDVREEVDRIEGELAALDAAAADASPSARAAIHYALGRAWFALDRLPEALDHLDMARSLGLDDPDLSLYVGRARVERFGREVVAVRREPDEAYRAGREAELADALLVPGLAALEEALADASGPADARSLARALVLRYRSGMDEATAALEAGAQTMDWPMPALLLESRLRFEAASALAFEESAGEIVGLLHEARDDAEATIAQSRSHPAAYRLRCRIAAARLALEVRGREIGTAPDLSDCDALLVVDATDPVNLVAVAEAYERRAALALSRGQSPGVDVEQVVRLADDALAQDASLAEAWRLRAAARFSAARDALQRGSEHGSLLTMATEDMTQALALEPGIAGWYGEFAEMLSWSARERYSRGLSGDAEYARAVDVLARASRLPGVGAATRIQLPSLLTWRSYYRYAVAGQLADGLIDEALVEARGVAAEYPELLAARASHAMAAWTAAEYRLFLGENAEPVATEAIEAFDRAVALAPDRFSLRYNRLSSHFVRIQSKQVRGEDAIAEIDRAAELLAELRGAFPEDPGLALQAANLGRLRAREAIRRGIDPADHFAAARESLSRADSVVLDAIEVAALHGWIAIDEHRWRLAADRFDPNRFAADRARMDRSIAALPRVPGLLAQRAALLATAGLAGIAARDGESADQLLAAAREDLVAAIDGNEVLSRRFASLREQLAIP